MSGGDESNDTLERGRVALRIHKDGEPIHTLDDWFRLAPPEKGLAQWRDGRSAEESARLWLTGFPTGISDTLDTNPGTAAFVPVECSPEVETELDEFPRPRQHDMLVIGETPTRPMLLTVEAKVDEPFDKLIGPKLSLARRNDYSNQPERIRRLIRALFGEDDVDEVAGLRYQLIAATAGTLIDGATRGVGACTFLVHVLSTHLTDQSKVERNASDLDLFVSKLAGVETRVDANRVVGPFVVPGGVGRIPKAAQIFVGKAVTDLRNQVTRPEALKNPVKGFDNPLF